MLYDLISCDFKTSWWFQPIWKMFVKMGENLSQFSGWKFLKKYLSCHPPTKMIPWKGWCRFFFIFSVVFMKKNCQIVGVSPQKSQSAFSSQNSTDEPGICGITVGNLRDLTRGSELYPQGEKPWGCTKFFGAPKKIMKIHEVEVFNRDHEILVYYSNP